MRKFLILLSLLCVYSSPSFAKNTLVYFGGGRSANPDDSLFDAGFLKVKQFSKNQNWDSEFYYRKSLPPNVSTEDIIKTKQFTASNFLGKIESLKTDILNGKFKDGDQLLVYIDTHGKPDENTKHIILAADDESVDSQALRDLIALAEEKKVKLGVVGANCYSGSLLRYRTPNTCIVTAAPEDKVGFNTDTNAFTDNMLLKQGATNLEDVFLNARWNKHLIYGPAQPMISTEAGVIVDEALSSIKDGIFYEVDLVKEQARPVCKNNSYMIDNLEQEIKKLSQVIRFSFTYLGLPATYKGKGGLIDIKQIQNLQAKLKNYQALYQQTTPFAVEGEQNVCSKKKSCFAARDVDAWEPYADTPEKLQLLKELRENPIYKKYKESTKGQEAEIKKMYDLSIEISRQERELYDQLYKIASKKVTGPNPCRDFKL